jgi:hypothetical protein
VDAAGRFALTPGESHDLMDGASSSTSRRPCWSTA